MKIAILCSLGPLDRYGYQYNYLPVMQSMSEFATCVYLHSSTRNQTHVDELLAQFSNVQYFSDESTWFDQNESGQELWNLKSLEKSINHTVEKCKQDGMDCVLYIHINQYIPEHVRLALKLQLQKMLEERRPFDWLYKGTQLADRLFHTSVRLPWILNLSIDNPYQIIADSIQHRENGQIITVENRVYRYSRRDSQAIIDCPLEMTLKDLEEKMNFLSCYSDIRPDTSPVFDWNTYFPYFLGKMSDRLICSTPLDRFGQAIKQNCQDDFVSRIILKSYKKPTYWNRAKITIRDLLANFK